MAEKAVEAVKVDGISIEDSSVKFNIPSQIIQEVLDGKIQVGTRRGPQPIPRKFKPGGEECSQRRQPDKSKHRILDSLVPEAATLCNCSRTTIKKYL